MEGVVLSRPDNFYDRDFYITCITSGGPATCVEWMRDGSEVVDTNYVSVLVDPVAGIYDHTLLVREALIGEYVCTVYNDKPNNVSGRILVKGKCVCNM